MGSAGWGGTDTWGVPDIWTDDVIPQPSMAVVATPLIHYRNLGPNNDPLWGQGKDNYLSNLPAVAQAVLTRLRLFQGEWWENLDDGLPLFQQILGRGASNTDQAAISLAITQRILGTPFVTTIESVQISFDRGTRLFTFYAVIQTQFGKFAITTNNPVPPFQGL